MSGFLLASCNQAPPDNITTMDKGLILVADDIIYDVIIKPPVPEDTWELERLKGYDGTEMINDFFDDIYSGELVVFDFYTGKSISANDVKKIEAKDGFKRENIGKIQFTEKWSYDPVANTLEKKIVSIVFGYESIAEDIQRTGYVAAFKIYFK